MSGSTALLLPILESNLLANAVVSSPTIPKRLVFLPMGYGVNARNWFPSKDQVGIDYELPPLLESFQDLKSDFSILQNLTNRHRLGPHDGTTNFLTCANMKAVPGLFTNSVSCDQLAAEVLGKDTRHSSIAIGSSDRRGNDGHGFAKGYASWGRDGKPVGLYRKMTDLYAALFGTGGKVNEVRAQLARKQSSLDAILGNAKRLNRQISSADRHRVDEYFTSVRNIEAGLSKAQDWVDRPYPKAPFPFPGRISGREEIELTLEMIRVAMQSDSSRVMTYMLPSSGILRDLGTRLNPHKMSHKAAGELDPNAVHQQRDRMLAELVSQFLRNVKETKEADGSSLLDHSLIAYGSSLRQGHNMSNGPMLLAGHGGGGLKQGQNIVYEENSTPLSNLWLSVLRHVGVDQTEFADSQRVLSEVGFS
ncbi:DUF1552 domain-containing protein [bacterium]|nr:DUF1552 domain-containing protein [bacterium]